MNINNFIATEIQSYFCDPLLYLSGKFHFGRGSIAGYWLLLAWLEVLPPLTRRFKVCLGPVWPYLATFSQKVNSWRLEEVVAIEHRRIPLATILREFLGLYFFKKRTETLLHCQKYSRKFASVSLENWRTMSISVGVRITWNCFFVTNKNSFRYK